MGLAHRHVDDHGVAGLGDRAGALRPRPSCLELTRRGGPVGGECATQSFQRIHGSFLSRAEMRTSQIRCKMRSPSRGAACSSLGELLAILCVEISLSRSGQTPKLVIFDTDSRSYPTRFCALRHGSGSESSPEFSGRFQRPQVISVFAPFPLVPGGNIPWKTGVFRSRWVLLTPRIFDFKGADSGLRKNFLLLRIDDYMLKHESFRIRRG